jgi:hypothetical protein
MFFWLWAMLSCRQMYAPRRSMQAPAKCGQLCPALTVSLSGGVDPVEQQWNEFPK